MNSKQQTKKQTIPSRFQPNPINKMIQPETLTSKQKKNPTKPSSYLSSIQEAKMKAEQSKIVSNCSLVHGGKKLSNENEGGIANKDSLLYRRSDYDRREVYRMTQMKDEHDQKTTFSVGRVKSNFPTYVSHKNVYKPKEFQQSLVPSANTYESNKADNKQASSFRKISIETNAIKKTIMDRVRSSNKRLASRLTCDSTNEYPNMKAPARKLKNLLDSNSSVLLTKRCATDSPLIHRPIVSNFTPFTEITYRICDHLFNRQNKYGKFDLREQSHTLFATQRFNPFVQFITEIGCKVEFNDRVLFLAIELFYFALRLKPLREFEFKTIALSAVAMAAKFENAWSFYVCPFFTWDCVVSGKMEMIEVERELLTALDFNLNLVLVSDLFGFLSSLLGLTKEERDYGFYFLNSALCFEDFQHSDKQSVAYALCRISTRMLGRRMLEREVVLEGKRQLKIDNQIEGNELVFDAQQIDSIVELFAKNEKTVLSKKGRAISELYSRDRFSQIAKRF